MTHCAFLENNNGDFQGKTLKFRSQQYELSVGWNREWLVVVKMLCTNYHSLTQICPKMNDVVWDYHPHYDSIYSAILQFTSVPASPTTDKDRPTDI